VSTAPTGNPVTRWLGQTFFAGLLALAPLYITFKILQIVFETVDKPLGRQINQLLQQLAGWDVHVPGLGILATATIVLLIGWLTRLALFRWVFRWLERAIERVPLVRWLYNGARQVVSQFAQNDLPFSEVCVVEYPMVGRYTLGMIARRTVSQDPTDDRVVVFFPSNHLHLGYPVILRRHEVQVIDMTVEDAIKFFVSCGVVGHDQLLTKGGVNLALRGASTVGAQVQQVS
jgi:uncharacterized membrane protein